MTNAATIRDALVAHHAEPWIVFPELQFGTGSGTGHDGYAMHYSGDKAPFNQSRIDVWAIHPYPSEKWRRVAYEIKVSRADFLHELKHPAKRKPALLVSNQFYFAAPAGLIHPEELPVEAGLVEINEEGRLRFRVSSPWRDTVPAPWMFVASLARRIQRAGIAQLEAATDAR